MSAREEARTLELEKELRLAIRALAGIRATLERTGATELELNKAAHKLADDALGELVYDVPVDCVRGSAQGAP